jgi:Lhr-like helicase
VAQGVSRAIAAVHRSRRTTGHSFQLNEVAHYLNSKGVRSLLIQAMLDAPMFTTRWRWVTAVALALPRFRSGKKVPPQLMRMQAEDLIAAVFPDQIACAENWCHWDRRCPSLTTERPASWPTNW